MAPMAGPSHFANPLATSTQLETSASQLDGVPKDIEESVHYETARLLQVAGILLRLPQEIVAQSIVTLQRFWVGPDGGSLLEYDADSAAAAALYLSAKPSAHAVSPRQLTTVFSYLSSLDGDYAAGAASKLDLNTTWYVSESEYESHRNRLYKLEAHMLRVLGFQTHVALPYTLCVNYLQALEVFHSPGGSAVAKRAFAHLNSALLSPQMLYLTHQPSALATASIYLAAREVDVKLTEVEWWEVFDVDREELGFLVVAMTSLEGFAAEEKRKWAKRRVPMVIEKLRVEVERQRVLEAGA